MKMKLAFFFIILIALCAISNVGAAEDANSTEIGITDEIALGEENSYQFNDTSYAFEDIKNRIESANDGDKIYFNGTFEFAGEVTVTKSITIEGVDDGATITRDTFTGNFRFFNIQSSHVVLNNLKFEYAAYTNGGAILWQGNYGVISNCEFNKNSASDSYGGAIYLNADNCNITNCNFTNNMAGYGGAVFIFGNNNLVNSSKFENNYCNNENSKGGAIFSDCNALTIEYCTFKSNHAESCGGAVAINESGGTISNSSFENNYVGGSNAIGGGAIYSGGNSLAVIECIFNRNRASNSNGGAIVLGKDNVVRNSSFANNSAVLGNDIYTNVTAYVLSNSFIIRHNETKNDAVYGISESDLSFNNFTVIKVNSTVSFSAGIIFQYGSTSNPILVTAEGGKIEQSTIKVLNHPEAKISYSKNILTVSNLAVGKYVMRITTIPDENHYSTYRDINVTVNKAIAVITASSTSVVLKKATYWKIKLVNSKTGKPISGMKLKLKVYTGKKYKTYTVKTNSNGIATFKTSSLAKGKHKMIVTGSHAGYTFNKLTKYVTVVKPTALKFKIENVKNTKKGSLISFKVTNKKTKKAVNGIKVKFMVKVGSKYTKFITLKTKTVSGIKGIVGFFTNELSVGKHVVLVKPVSIKYSGSGKGTIKIKKSSKKYPDKTTNV